MQNEKISLKKVNPDAIIPSYQTDGAAGFDFHSIEDKILQKGDTVSIKTGLAIELPKNLELQIRSRSGLAIRNNIFVLNSPGTIDSDFRGEIVIILMNLGDEFVIKKGDRIAQGVIASYVKASFDVVETLTASVRGEKGFGSTGK